MTFGPVGLDMSGTAGGAEAVWETGWQDQREPRFRVTSRRIAGESLAVVEAPLLALIALILTVSMLMAPGNQIRGTGIDLPDIVFCPFLAITHIPCLLCGLTRSFMSMGGLDIRQAFIFHPLGPILYGAMLGVGGVMAWSLARRRRVSVRLRGTARGALVRYGALVLLAAWLVKLVIWRQTGLL